MRIATTTFVLALLLAPKGTQAQVTPLTGPVVTANDDAAPAGDSFTVRGRIDSGTDLVADSVSSGTTVSIFQASYSNGVACPGYAEIDSETFDASECKAVTAGLSLYCKDTASGSFLRLRGTRARPGSWRVIASVRGHDFDPGKPFGMLGSSVSGGIIGAFSSLPALRRTVAAGFSGLGLAMTGLIAINAHEWLIKNNESYKKLVDRVSEALSGTVNYSNVLEDLSGIYRKLSDSVDSLREKLMISITGTGIETFLNGLKKDLKELDFLEKLSSILTDINNTLDAISNRDISQAASNIGHLLGLGQQKPSVGDENSTSSGSGSSVTEPPNSSSEWAIKNRSMLDDLWTFIQRRAGGSVQSSPSENENLGQSPRAFIESTQKMI
jgi:hypothetical protein